MRALYFLIGFLVVLGLPRSSFGQLTEPSGLSETDSLLDTLEGTLDVRGTTRFALPHKPEAIIVMIVGTDCPLAASQLQNLAALHNSYGRKIAFYVVFGNGNDQRSEVLKFANGTHRKNRAPIRFKVIYDANQRIVDLTKAKNLGHTVVVDADGEIRYWGGIDNAFFAKNEAETKSFVKDAIESILNQREVKVKWGEVVGCRITNGDE